jgi:hypothetical protein
MELEAQLSVKHLLSTWKTLVQSTALKKKNAQGGNKCIVSIESLCCSIY